MCGNINIKTITYSKQDEWTTETRFDLCILFDVVTYLRGDDSICSDLMVLNT